jgi:hypothetical protein
MTIYTFYKREHQFRQIMSTNRTLNRSRYFRLMALSSIEILGTIPLGTYWIVFNASKGIQPWKGWAWEHADYSRVEQVPAFAWKADPGAVTGLEAFRWSLVACAFIFFAFFGFADEARQHYRLVYTSLASRMGITTSSGTTLLGSSHAYVLVFNMLPALHSCAHTCFFSFQHVVFTSFEEQERRRGLYRHNGRQARLDYYCIRSAFDPVSFHRQRF